MTDDVRLNRPTREELFAQMVDQPSDTLDVHITRDRTPGKTFSPEPLDEMADTLRTFIMARLYGDMRKHPEGHERLSVAMRVTIDGRSIRAKEEERPWYIIEGRSRAQAAQGANPVTSQAEAEAMQRVGEQLRRLPLDTRRRVISMMLDKYNA